VDECGPNGNDLQFSLRDPRRGGSAVSVINFYDPNRTHAAGREEEEEEEEEEEQKDEERVEERASAVSEPETLASATRLEQRSRFGRRAKYIETYIGAIELSSSKESEEPHRENASLPAKRRWVKLGRWRNLADVIADG